MQSGLAADHVSAQEQLYAGRKPTKSGVIALTSNFFTFLSHGRWAGRHLYQAK